MYPDNEYLATAREIAQKAGQLLLKRFPSRQNLSVRQRAILMEQADLEVHDFICNQLYLKYPMHSFVSVFTKNRKFYNDRALWVIDPIVGLGNFGHGDPSFALSIAYIEKGIVKVAVIHNPIFGQMFTAVHGGGAYLNGMKLQVSRTVRLKDSLLSTRFPYDIRTADETNIEAFNKLVLKAESVRNNGCATLDIAYVASGQYDGFWAIGMNPWDLIAAALLVEEAGGRVTGLKGEPYQTEAKSILTSNNFLHDEILEVMLNANKSKVKK